MASCVAVIIRIYQVRVQRTCTRYQVLNREEARKEKRGRPRSECERTQGGRGKPEKEGERRHLVHDRGGWHKHRKQHDYVIAVRLIACMHLPCAPLQYRKATQQQAVP